MSVKYKIFFHLKDFQPPKGNAYNKIWILVDDFKVLSQKLNQLLN